MPSSKTDLAIGQEQLDAADQEVRVKHPVEQRPVVRDGETVPDEFEYVVPLKDKKFLIAESVGFMPIAKFARFQKISVDDPRAMEALYDMLQNVIHDDAWDDFELHASETRANADDLLDVVSAVLEHLSGRPTEQRGGSSPTSRGTSTGSTAKSSAKRAKA